MCMDGAEEAGVLSGKPFLFLFYCFLSHLLPVGGARAADVLSRAVAQPHLAASRLRFVNPVYV